MPLLHAAQVAPQALSLLHTAHAPLTHCLFEPHELTVHSQLAPLQVGVLTPHAAQVAPQWVASVHAVQVPPLHQLPAQHWAFVMHCTHVVPPLHTFAVAAQLVQALPQCWSLLQARQVPLLHHLPLPQSASMLQFWQTPSTQPYVHVVSDGV